MGVDTSDQAIEAVLHAHKRQIHAMAWTCLRKLPSSSVLSQEDLYGEGLAEFVKVYARHDPTQTKFITLLTVFLTNRFSKLVTYEWRKCRQAHTVSIESPSTRPRGKAGGSQRTQSKPISPALIEAPGQHAVDVAIDLERYWARTTAVVPQAQAGSSAGLKDRYRALRQASLVVAGQRSRGKRKKIQPTRSQGRNRTPLVSFPPYTPRATA